MNKLAIFVKKNWYFIAISTIVLVAILLRFYKLGEIPHGMTWDEAAIGYNGFAIFNTRRDEWLNKLPVSFTSFGDYKAPLAIYINGVFTFLFGMNLMAVRFPFALSSIFAILGAVLLTKEVFKDNRFVKYYSIFVAFLMTLSPWHIHYSRAGFESGMALSFLIWAIFLTFKSINEKFKNQLSSVFAALFYLASIYTYHSSKVVVPLSLFILFIINSKLILKNIKKIFLPLVLFIISLAPFIKDSLVGEGLTRAGVTIISSSLPFTEKLSYVISSYVSHLSFGFLLFGETTTLRHGTGYLGVLFATTLVLVLIGVVALFKSKINRENKLFFFWLIIVGLLPACISMEVPHANRSLLALPGFMLTAIFGLDLLISKLNSINLNKISSGSKGEKNIITKSAIGLILIIHILFSVSFLNHYFTQFSKESADDFKDGYIEAFEIAEKYEKGLDGYPTVEKIIFTSRYGQPYIYALFVRETNPIWYQGGSLIKYEFYENINVGDLMRNNALIVASKDDEMPIEKADHVVYGSDGEVRFILFKTENKQ